APPSRFPPLPQDTQAEPLWQAVLDELAATVTRPIFETYLAGTRGAAVEAGQLVVSVPSDFVAEWLGRMLAPLIQQSLTRITGIAAGVILKAELEGSSSARPMPSTQAAQFEHAP